MSKFKRAFSLAGKAVEILSFITTVFIFIYFYSFRNDVIGSLTVWDSTIRQLIASGYVTGTVFDLAGATSAFNIIVLLFGLEVIWSFILLFRRK